MRNYFAEGDLLVCEVQAFFQDGSVSLHTRSLKYGKLRNGQLVKARSGLMPRLKSHFIALPNGIELIAGLNGYIWVGISSVEATDAEDQDLYANRTDDMTNEQRANLSRVAAAIQIIAADGMLLSEQRINAAWDASVEGGEEGDVVPNFDLSFSRKARSDILQRVQASEMVEVT